MSKRHTTLFAILCVVIVFNLLDAIATLYAVQAGLALEANPLMNALLGYNPVSFMAGKITLVSLGILLLWRLRHLSKTMIAAVTVLMVYTGIVLWHTYGLAF